MTERRYEGGPEPTDAEVDAMFAALVAGLSAEPSPGAPATRTSEDGGQQTRAEPAAPLTPVPPTIRPARIVEPGPPEPVERYRPELVPLGRPSVPILIGWTAMTVSVLATLLAIFGVPLPEWTGWVAVCSFLGGFGLLVSQLPRHRPPDAGDGAVL